MVNNGLPTGSSFGNPSPQPGLGQGGNHRALDNYLRGTAPPPAWQHLQKRSIELPQKERPEFHNRKTNYDIDSYLSRNYFCKLENDMFEIEAEVF